MRHSRETSCSVLPAVTLPRRLTTAHRRGITVVPRRTAKSVVINVHLRHNIKQTVAVLWWNTRREDEKIGVYFCACLTNFDFILPMIIFLKKMTFAHCFTSHSVAYAIQRKTIVIVVGGQPVTLRMCAHVCVSLCVYLCVCLVLICWTALSRIYCGHVYVATQLVLLRLQCAPTTRYAYQSISISLGRFSISYLYTSRSHCSVGCSISYDAVKAIRHRCWRLYSLNTVISCPSPLAWHQLHKILWNNVSMNSRKIEWK